LTRLGQERLEVLPHHPVKQRLLRLPPRVVGGQWARCCPLHRLVRLRPPPRQPPPPATQRLLAPPDAQLLGGQKGEVRQLLVFGLDRLGRSLRDLLLLLDDLQASRRDSKEASIAMIEVKNDRFLIRLTLGHPSPAIEAELLRTRGDADPVRALASVAGADELMQLQAVASTVRVDEAIADYAVRLATATRAHPEIERGASTRAALALMAAAKAHALWETRHFVTPGDLRAVLAPSWSHRLLLRSAVHGTFSRDEAAHLLEELARKVPAPR
jgi:hypothetical protein